MKTHPLPYPGLRPFEFGDSGIFFGREEQTIALLDRVAKDNFVAVVGSSGCGKSSLVKAGLLPAIEDGGLKGHRRWKFVQVKPGDDPLPRLALRLCQTWNRPELQNEVLDKLHESDFGLIDALEVLQAPAEERVLIIVDQFEELFGSRTRHEAGDRSAAARKFRDESNIFVKLILTAVNSVEESRLSTIITLRSDFIGHCDKFLELPAQVSRSQFLVPRLRSSEMEAAICGPSFADQIPGAGYPRFEVNRELLQKIIREAGDRPDYLPLMQHALMLTWKKCGAADRASVELTVGQFDSAGGVSDSLDWEADKAYAELQGGHLRDIARILFLSLTEVGNDGIITRRRSTMQEVMAIAEADFDAVHKVAMTFRKDDRNFLILDDHASPASVMDVGHESLLRNWKKLENWIKDETDGVEEYRSLVKRAQRHHAKTGTHTFLSEVDVGRAGEWLAKTKPNLAWARRYSNDPKNSAIEFERVVQFVTESEGNAEALRELREQKDRERAMAEERAQRAELMTKLQRQEASAARRKQRVIVGAIATGAILLLLLVRSYFVDTESRRLASLAQRTEQFSKRNLDTALRMKDSENRASHVKALNLAARSMRLTPEKPLPAKTVTELLAKRQWCVPLTPSLSYDNADTAILSAALSPDGKGVHAISRDGHLLSWPPKRGSEKLNWETEALNSPYFDPLQKLFPGDKKVLIYSGGFNPAATRMITVRADGMAQFWRWRDDHYLQITEPLRLNVSGTAYRSFVWLRNKSCDLLLISTLQWEKQQASSQLFVIKDNMVKELPLDKSDKAAAACFSADGRSLLVAMSDGDLYWWDVNDETVTPKTTEVFNVGFVRPNGLSLSTSSRYVMATAWQVPPSLLDLTSGSYKSVALPAGLRDLVSRAVFCSNSEHESMVALATTNRLEFVDVETLIQKRFEQDLIRWTPKAMLAEPLTFQGSCIPIFSQDGRQLLTLSGSSIVALDTVRVWQTPRLDFKAVAVPDSGPVPEWVAGLAAAVSDDGNHSEDERQRSIQVIYRDQSSKGPWKPLWDQFSPSKSWTPVSYTAASTSE